MPEIIDQLPTIALTMGAPAGVGSEIVLKALADPEVAPLATWIVVGDSRILEMAERATGLPLASALLLDSPALGDIEDFSFGRLDARCGQAAVEYVRLAAEMCLRGAADAMVTAPLNKEAVTLSGRPFSGHTEYIAELCGAAESRMLLASERLATVHVSTHVPLRQACDLNTGRIVRTIELGEEAMRLLGFEQPRIAVCGLNPHAGEHGLVADVGHVRLRRPFQEAERLPLDPGHGPGLAPGDGGPVVSQGHAQVVPIARAVADGAKAEGGGAPAFMGEGVDLGGQQPEEAGFPQQGPQPEHRLQPQQAVGDVRQVGRPVHHRAQPLHRLPGRLPGAGRGAGETGEGPEKAR